MLFYRSIASTLPLLLLSGGLGSAAAFNAAKRSPVVGTKEQRAASPSPSGSKNLASVVAAGVVAVTLLTPLALPDPAVAADSAAVSAVVGTPLESKLARFGAASYPVFNSVTDVSPLADKFLDLVDKKVKGPDAADAARKTVDGLLAIPDSKINEYRNVLKTQVYSGVSDKSCVTLGGSGAAARKVASSSLLKSVDSSKIEQLRKKFEPANSAVPTKDGNICLPGSGPASEKLWVAQAELTLSMPKAEAGALVSSIKKAGGQLTRPSLATLVPAAEGVFSKSPEALKMAAAGNYVEPNVIATVLANLI